MKKMHTSLAQLSQAIGLVWASSRGWTLVNLVAATVLGVIPAGSLYLTKLLVDALAVWLAEPSSAEALVTLSQLAVPVVGLLALGGICRALAIISSEAQSSAVANHVQGILQAKALVVDYQCYENPAFHDTMRMAQGEALSRPTRIAQNLSQSLRELLTLLSVAGVLVSSHAYLAPIVLLAVIPGTVVRVLNSRRLHAWHLRHTADERYASCLNMLLTSVGFAKEARVFGHGPTIREKFRRLRDRLRTSRLTQTRERLLRQSGADMLSLALAAGGVALVVMRLQAGQMHFTMGDLALLFRAFQRAKGGLSGWLSSLTSLYEDSIFIAHFYDFMALPSTIRSPEAPQSLPAVMREGVALEAVSFRYPGTEREVLRDVSLRIRPGEHVAIVGENGAGKTTLAKLICRLYDPDSGRITIDGTDIRDVKIEALRRYMSLLFQDYARYFMSAEENIRMGDVSILPNDPRIREAARLAGADRLIDELPAGYATPLGRLFDGGVELSVGQWQRIALARTLVRDAPLVVLDEHTSALDPKAERQVLHQLFESVKGKTVVIISHRLTTVTMVDRIIVMEQGRVVEQGSHAELMARGGPYVALFADQGG